MKIPIYQVDAFADRPFAGNPAAVCPLDAWLPDAVLQAIAQENNLSETAFLVPRGEDWELRWLTPAMEVDLCGHATLASAFVLFDVLGVDRPAVVFHTRSGPLTVKRAESGLVMDFPAIAARPATPEQADAVASALGTEPLEVLASAKPLAILPDEAAVRAAAPDLRQVAAFEGGLIVTAPGSDCDFVSRYFAPHHGIPEDPVTGSAHCILAPFWAGRLGKTDLAAHQVSARGGRLGCRLMGDRVELCGSAVLYMEGTIRV